MKLVSIHLLVLSATVAVPPKHVFEGIEEDGLDRLLEIGAVRKFDKETDAGLPVFSRAGALAAPDTGKATDLSTLTKAQLLKIAEDEEIVVDSKATNAVILAAIEAGRAAADEDNLV